MGWIQRMCSLKGIWAFCALLPFAPSPAYAQIRSPEFIQENAFDDFQAGSWSATAAYFDQEDYAFGPHYQCLMSTDGAALIQSRPHESPDMLSVWIFSRKEPEFPHSLRVNSIRINDQSYDVARLPWRLGGPVAPGGIYPTFDLELLVFRQGSDQPWLPFTYLTSEMLRARHFVLSYSFENEEGGVEQRRKRISLEGFAEVSRWCGRQLLRNRWGQERVDELTL